jgi:soluble cytochrome b562
MNINDVKEYYKVQNSEEIFDITTPPDYQCGYIDALIKKVNGAIKYLDYKQNEENEELINRIDDAEYLLRYMEEDLEELRKAISDVRDWGNDWKRLAKRGIEIFAETIDDVDKLI